MKCRLSLLYLLIFSRSFSQTQTCPANISFSSGDLTHWFAYTGNNQQGNGPIAIKKTYDSTRRAPNGTIGVRKLFEYNLPNVNGIEVISSPTTDPFGFFSTIPTINGYTYDYSIKLGSTSVTQGNGNNGQGAGGYVRGVSYTINVPPGPATEPYTMTYAYAMVLENGTHVSAQQPLISAKLRTPAGLITCASPSYYLPTFDNVTDGGRGATLDSVKAKKNGFSVSREPTPNADPNANANNGPIYAVDVWVKGWTEVTFDLAPYRGQQVTLTFEADNCRPGGHFAYGYIAIRNNCAGLMISGDSLVCNNSFITYSVPALDSAKYKWNIPASWTLASSDTGNIIRVKTSNLGGRISVREVNSCADLSDVMDINTLPSPVGGILEGATEVCTGENSSILKLTNYSGTIMTWLTSTDNLSWSVLPNTTPQYIAENLETSTYYKVQVGKGDVCPPDTSQGATVMVDQKTIGGRVSPLNSVLCADQIAGEILTLSGNTGSVQRWQYSTNGIVWSDALPLDTSLLHTVKDITINTQFRAIDKNGVCPADTSSVASITFNPIKFPSAQTAPADTTICYGTTALLDAFIQVGTSYTWTPVSAGSGNFKSLPDHLSKSVTPDSTTDYILSILNAGCPNALRDTFHVEVLAKVVVDAGSDTSVVVGEPLQFHAVSSDEGPDTFLWTPITGLSDPSIANPDAVFNASDNTITYTVKATTPFGCSGEGSFTVKVFKTRPDIFVPNAFTPGGIVNSIFRPIPVGISSIEYFRVYNRLGQLVFATSSLGRGWDGRLNGVPQDPGGYVWMVKGTDYTGNIITKKGLMVLVR